MNSYQSNITKIYFYGFFYMFLIIVPIIVPYFLSLGLSMEDVFIIQAFFGFSVAVFEVPSAYLGDLWGRKNILILGSFISGIGLSLLLFAHDFWSLLAYEVFLGIGASFVSGADLSILYDSLRNDRKIKTKSLANFHGLQLVGEAFAAVTCSALMFFSYKHVIWGQVVVGWVPFVISIFLIEPEIEKMDKNKHKENIKEVFSFIFKQDAFMRVLFLNMVCWSLSTFIAVWIIQKYWQDQNIALYNLGYLWALCNLTAAFVGRYAAALEGKLGPRLLLSVMCFLPILGYLGMGVLGGTFGILMTFSFYISRGINMVVMKEAFNHRIPSKFRNTANSLSSLFFRLSFFVGGPAVGFLIDTKGLSFALICISCFFLAMFFVLMLPMLKKV